MTPEANLQKVIHDINNQIQIVKHKLDLVPLNRSAILKLMQKRTSDLNVLVGHKNGTKMFRAALVDLAALLTYAAAECDEGRVGVE